MLLHTKFAGNHQPATMIQKPVSALFRSVLRRQVLQTTRAHHEGLSLTACRAYFNSSQKLPFSTLGQYLVSLPSNHDLHSPPFRRFMSTEAVPEEDWPRFEDKDNLHPSSKQSIQNMGLITMTEIQAKTFDAAASGKDVLARARTGTGKTLAFLLPALEKILRNPVEGQINMLVLSPTRELAAQIGEQARQLISTHRGISYQVIYGGISRRIDIDRFQQRIPTILVATPGRIQDHLDNTYVRDKRFSTLFHKTQILVLDEMDRLLDMGFRNDVEKILTYLPMNRQTLMFSATLPPEVRRIIQQSLQKDHLVVDCIHDADPTTHTNELVQQSRVMISSDNVFRGTVGILLNLLQDPNAKLVVFFPTTKMVSFYSEFFNYGLNRTVMEIHSGKSQSYRTSASNRFRELKKGVLFTSDVSARGVDYPGVTHVVQVGIADSRESYIHRLGRTARAGQKGHGLLILSHFEQGFLPTLTGLNIPVNEELQKLVDSPPSEALKKELDPVLESIHNGRNRSLAKSAQGAYRGMLGFYNSQLKRIGVRSIDRLIEFLNSFALQTGLSQVPGMSASTAKQMGIYGAAGLHYHAEEKSGFFPHGTARVVPVGRQSWKGHSEGPRKRSSFRPAGRR